ncbi:chlorite dismutase family protein [Gulosibacter molinativorax]|uniref:hydrogen peroxide-dependent heme synthase n=1 Tax=Gulosibacter molinativorax TaxID=256821 RepID=A0ABT7C6A2_9MICO|nr:chlorite dismutase family protein [Gulosibacter molinativorax]MDJ1370713.1 hypothetical protein [Gulosibacter molinativorax]QUY63261.1 Hypotetical protein [Gulosibacter molinativorax]
MSEPTDFTERAALYSLFLVFAETELIESRASANEAIRLTNELETVFSELAESHVRVRGAYDLTGFDTSASVMIWLTSETVDDLQWAKRQLHRTQLLGDTLVIESVLALGVSEIEEDPRTWVSLAPVSPGSVDADSEEEIFGEDELDDPDVDNLDPEFAGDLESEVLAARELVSEGIDAAVTPRSEGRHALGGSRSEDEEEVEEEGGLEGDTTSLHAQLGVGPIRLYAAVETDDPSELIGPSLGLLESGLMTVATPRTGRIVTPAELYEILR